MPSHMLTTILWVGAVAVLALLIVRRRQRKSRDF
jgi:hypothetical protein